MLMESCVMGLNGLKRGVDYETLGNLVCEIYLSLVLIILTVNTFRLLFKYVVMGNIKKN